MAEELIKRSAAIDAVDEALRRIIVAPVGKDILDRVPTVDAVPVRHGRWIDKDGSIATCSACGDRWGVWSVMRYCPNCGARMDGKDEA